MESKKNSMYCRICLQLLSKKCYLLAKSTNKGFTATGAALFTLTSVDFRAEVRDHDGPSRLCKSCYDLVMRVKKNEEDVVAKKASLKESLAKSRSFFFRTKHPREPSSPMTSKIPTPTRSPAPKRCLTEQNQRTSARALTFAPPTTTDCERVPQMVKPVSPFAESIPKTKSGRVEHNMTISSTVPLASQEPRTKTAFTALSKLSGSELNKLQLVLDEECDKLCRPDSLFRKASAVPKKDFSWQAYEYELKKTAPTLWLVLSTASTSLGTTYKRKHTSLTTASIVAAAVLLNERNSHVCMWCTAPIVTVTMAWSSIHYGESTHLVLNEY
jgi:hypothetical protein